MVELSKIRNQWFINQVLLLEKKGLSKAQIARDISVLPQYLTPILSGKRNASEQIVAKLCRVYSINHDDLLKLGLNYNLPNDSEHVAYESGVTYNFAQPLSIPLISPSTITQFFDGGVVDLKCERYTIPLFKGADFLLSVRDSSMQPTYNSGDIVACQKVPNDTFFQWGRIYVVVTEQGALVKRIKKGSSDSTIMLSSDNPKYDEFEIQRGKISHIALVIGAIRLE